MSWLSDLVIRRKPAPPVPPPTAPPVRNMVDLVDDGMYLLVQRQGEAFDIICATRSAEALLDFVGEELPAISLPMPPRR